jgi:hypothetical protein
MHGMDPRLRGNDVRANHHLVPDDRTNDTAAFTTALDFLLTAEPPQSMRTRFLLPGER